MRFRLRQKLEQKYVDVVIISYETLRNEILFFEQFYFHYCILDEGHVIKNPASKTTLAVKRISAFHRLILTGTPIQVRYGKNISCLRYQNHVSELWSLFDFLMPGFLGTEKEFRSKYSRPIQAYKDSKKNQDAAFLALESLHKRVLPFILRRLKQDVLRDLPPRIIQDYYCELSPLQVCFINYLEN